jgi:hypothetical protein
MVLDTDAHAIISCRADLGSVGWAEIDPWIDVGIAARRGDEVG